MPTIRDLLARRTDLSTFVVHLTRQDGDNDPAKNLKAILDSGRIEARSEFGSAVDLLDERDLSEEDYKSQRCVCFTETPLEHIHLLLQKITDLKRKCVFAPYGIAITKNVARRTGINPIWYTDMTVVPGGGHKMANQECEQAGGAGIGRPRRAA